MIMSRYCTSHFWSLTYNKLWVWWCWWYHRPTATVFRHRFGIVSQKTK